MIPQVYPNTWRVYFPQDNNTTEAGSISTRSSATLSLSVQGLLATLRLICDLVINSEAKFCLFIDGLDEYEGNANDMIDLIRLLMALPNLKLCLSSRAWNEFEQEFGKDCTQKPYMHDFNSYDISAYVHDTFVKDENNQELEDIGRTAMSLYKRLLKHVMGCSCGFSWLYDHCSKVS
jgi:hypothetical protein